MILLAGLICRKRESQLVCSSAGRVGVPSSEDGGRSKAERSDVLLKSVGAVQDGLVTTSHQGCRGGNKMTQV